MANQPNLNKCDLSPEAAKSRRDYYRKYRNENKDIVRATKLRYWEKKAQEYYGVDYVGPESPEELSRQAQEVRRKYYAAYRTRKPEVISKATKNYWERKANNEKES